MPGDVPGGLHGHARRQPVDCRGIAVLAAAGRCRRRTVERNAQRPAGSQVCVAGSDFDLNRDYVHIYQLQRLDPGAYITADLGFTALSTTPVLLAMVQEHLPNNRAVGNGIFMLISFALRPIAILAVGYMGDRLGLRTAFTWSALISLLAVPAIFALPDLRKQPNDE